MNIYLQNGKSELTVMVTEEKLDHFFPKRDQKGIKYFKIFIKRNSNQEKEEGDTTYFDFKKRTD